ncbi:hypothetical protein RHOSPDRAFT_33429 [Rhodotorula sp. JG-1b]|nr:hypothetical protein RHOSPDRAFT_33429 [Rhodotorula sp. JG-1b]
MSGVGYHWPALAQQAFMAGTCRNNQSISQWCSLSAGDQCCGALCPNAPITGPGTIIAFTVGTMMNMLVTFLWKSEAPYNILWQLLSTDGACVALLFRLLLTENRLTEFHAAFVPLAVMSCLPVTVAACTVEVGFMHNLDYNSYLALWKKYLDEKMEEAKAHPDRRELEKHFHGPYDVDQRVVLQRLIKHDKIFGGMVPRRYLPMIVLGVFGVHIIVWAFLLIMSLTVGATDAFQRNCSSDLPIAYWSRVVGIVAMAHWAVMVLLWFLFLASLIKWSVKPKTKNKTEDEKKRYQRDPLEILARLTHWPWLMDVVHPIKEGWSLKREIVRWSISSFFYFVWFSAYVSLYILALQRFVMVGDNPFDYGQVAACVGTLGGTITVVRCIVNESAYYRNRNETTHSNSFIHRLRNSVVGNKDVCRHELPNAFFQSLECQTQTFDARLGSPSGHRQEVHVPPATLRRTQLGRAGLAPCAIGTVETLDAFLRSSS